MRFRTFGRKHLFLYVAMAAWCAAQVARASLGETRDQLVSHFGEPQTETEFWFDAYDKGKEGRDFEEWKWVAFPTSDAFDPQLGNVKVPGVTWARFIKNKVVIHAALYQTQCVAIEYKGDSFDRKMMLGDGSLFPALLQQNGQGSTWPVNSIERLSRGDRIIRKDGRAFAVIPHDPFPDHGNWLLVCSSNWPKMLDDALARAKHQAETQRKRQNSDFYNAPPDAKTPPPFPTFAVKVIQKVDDRENGLLCLQIGVEKVIFVTGYPNAANVTDGDQLIFRGEPSGTYSYVTTRGSQATVRKIRWAGEAQ